MQQLMGAGRGRLLLLVVTQHVAQLRCAVAVARAEAQPPEAVPACERALL